MDEGILTFTHHTQLNDKQHLFMRVCTAETKKATRLQSPHALLMLN